MDESMKLAKELEVASTLARLAGQRIRRFRAEEFAAHDKADGEPVTAADLAAQEIIVGGLREAFPRDAILSEEAPGELQTRGRCWVIDPLDGTRDFITETGDYAVMVGLCVDGRPVLGAVHHPPVDRLYRGAVDHPLEQVDPDGGITPLRMSPPVDVSLLRLVVSRSHYDPWFDEVKGRLGLTGDSRRGSVGLKVTLLAAGEHDLYLHRHGLKVWDTCAPQALLEAAGGRMGTLGGAPLDYHSGVLLTRGMLATHASVFDEVVERLAPLVREGV